MIAQSVNIHLVSDIDVDLLIRPKGFSFDRAWEKRIQIQAGKSEIYFVSREDLIKMKEATGRPQDKLDVERLKKI